MTVIELTPGPYRIGIDLVEIARVTRLLGSRPAARSIFTAAELRFCGQASLAGRLAAKEATLKALGTGLGLPPSRRLLGEAEIVQLAGGAPVLRLHGKLARQAARLGLTSAVVTITHTAGLAIAQVLLASEPGSQPGGGDTALLPRRDDV